MSRKAVWVFIPSLWEARICQVHKKGKPCVHGKPWLILSYHFLATGYLLQQTQSSSERLFLMTADIGLAKQRSLVAFRWKSGKVTKTQSVFMCKCIHMLNLNFISKISLYIRGFFPLKLKLCYAFGFQNWWHWLCILNLVDNSVDDWYGPFESILALQP